MDFGTRYKEVICKKEKVVTGVVCFQRLCNKDRSRQQPYYLKIPKHPPQKKSCVYHIYNKIEYETVVWGDEED